MVEEEYVRTSLRMTRVITDEIGSTLEDILQKIYNVSDIDAEDEDKINFSYAQWQFLVTQLFHDEVLIMALNKTIIGARDRGIDLNRNRMFLDYILEHVGLELKTEIMEKQHPIADLSMKNRVGGKKQRESTIRKAGDVSW